MPPITILYTGDIHAHVNQFLRAAYMAQQLRYELNAVGHHVCLVDSGDIEDQSVIESDLSKGTAMFRLLKAAEYDACVVGNGAPIAYGPQIVETIANASQLPILCANVLTLDGNPLPGTQPNLILHQEPVKLGLIGLTTEIAIYRKAFALTLPDTIDVTHEHVENLHRQGCNAVGVVSHLGYERDIELAKAIPELNFIIGGHSHTALLYPTNVNGVLVCHSGDYGHFLGRLDLTIEDEQVTGWHGQLLRVPADEPEHPAAAHAWQVIQHETEKKLSEPIGYLDTAVDVTPNSACGMGQLLADALRFRMHADIGLCITGHVHAGLPKGPITLANVLNACQSPANAAVVNLNGAQIIHALEHAANPLIWQHHPHLLRGQTAGIMQVSGLTYHLSPGAAVGRCVSDVRVTGQPIDFYAHYRVASTDYELAPNRGYFPDLKINTVVFDVPWVLREVLQDHLRKFSPLSPGLRPRITVKGADIRPIHQRKRRYQS
ncbi:MAG: bifunctional metallophosphatase/5'-nucleotidase [Anaerolineae bacterium]|nr:bifunctional metallophosphatase/5'-nucleotidase [Anaerolineae bacterium]